MQTGQAQLDTEAGLAAATSLDMPRALRAVGVAGLVGVVPACLLPGSLVSGEVGGLALLLTPALAVGAVLFYGRSRPPVVASAVAGRRIGALLGLWMGSLIAAATGIAGYVLRYGYHSHVMDDKIGQAAAQMPAQLRAAGPTPPELLAFLQTPEFRAGTFIFGHVFSLVLLVAVGSLCGWMASTVLRARRQRSID
ncbi:MAG: hypothetical protein ACRYF4_13155 [Janthinobacterium lividum]